MNSPPALRSSNHSALCIMKPAQPGSSYMGEVTGSAGRCQVPRAHGPLFPPQGPPTVRILSASVIAPASSPWLRASSNTSCAHIKHLTRGLLGDALHHHGRTPHSSTSRPRLTFPLIIRARASRPFFVRMPSLTGLYDTSRAARQINPPSPPCALPPLLCPPRPNLSIRHSFSAIHDHAAPCPFALRPELAWPPRRNHRLRSFAHYITVSLTSTRQAAPAPARAGQAAVSRRTMQ
ncbi:hypothetical protein C8Q79DRAFT_83008 [Trametes meyenii]|nr:hypothetical protein C8Q79DRAFT_83008 [Trametes meyenii]